jgi:hypothetical protein
MRSDLLYGDICRTKLNKIVIFPYIFPIQVPRAKLRFEVLFKRFHPRINLTTLFSTKIYLLNTIKLFSDHENRSLKPKQQNIVGHISGNSLLSDSIWRLVSKMVAKIQRSISQYFCVLFLH